MTARTKTLALLAAGATAAGSFGAAAASATARHGSQDGGRGDAPTFRDRGHGDHHRGQKVALKRLAHALDVSRGDLRDALRDARDDAKDASQEALAEALGLNEKELRKAVREARDLLRDGEAAPAPPAEPQPTTPEQPTTPAPPAADSRTAPDGGEGERDERPDGPAPFAAALAQVLEQDVAKVTDALGTAREAAEEAFVDTLADELDRSERAVRRALAKVWPAEKPAKPDAGKPDAGKPDGGEPGTGDGDAAEQPGTTDGHTPVAPAPGSAG